ncbi:GLPGLI family protein [Vaginella massiliensis]|uniref:GLPGLI family protein n=1 Tax=Vaginella massiliensis TaxID=1816680 RepID=UPI003750790A
MIGTLVNVQNYQLTYEFSNHIPVFSKTNYYTTTLKYDDQNKVALYTVYLKGTNQKGGLIDDNKIVLTTPKIDDFLVYQDMKSNKMYLQDQIDIEMMIFEEEIPQLSWQLSDEERVINDFVVKKATTSFRGRNYTAWYTLDIPITYGPWKLNGLPGAIVEVTEDKNKYAWHLKSFKKVDEELENPIAKTKYKKLSIKEYPQHKFVDPARIKAKLRQVNPEGTFPAYQRSDLELKFEWE